MFMRDFFYKTFTLSLFILAIGLFYNAIVASYFTVFINLVLIIISIFVLLQACGRVDKALGLGKYANNGSDANNASTPNTKIN